MESIVMHRGPAYNFLFDSNSNLASHPPVGISGGYIYSTRNVLATQIFEVSATPKFPAQSNWPPVLSDWSQPLLDLTNAHRKSIGLNGLVFHPVTQGISDWKTRNCAQYIYMDHNTPSEPDWNFPARGIGDRFTDLGYPIGMAWGENLAYGFLDPESVFDAWMSDIGHRQNIENSSWTTCGMSACKDPKSGLIFQGQDFTTYVVAPVPTPTPTPTPPPTPQPVPAPKPAKNQIWLNPNKVKRLVVSVTPTKVNHVPAARPKTNPTATAIHKFETTFTYVSG